MPTRYRPPSALPTIVQIAVVGAIFAVAVVALVLSSVVTRRENAAVAQPTPESIPAGYFKPTDDQWRSLTIASVRAVPFGDVSETSGTIGSTDDGTTQVFSPFTGRIDRVFVTVGDAVRKGEPLFSGEGGEIAQAVSDLASAEASLRAARVQFEVTRTNRQRLLALQRVDGAPTKDVEQSRSDVAAALATVRNDEIAVGLARSRLRVLGEGDGGSRSGAGSPTAALVTRSVVRAPIDGIVTQRAVGPGQYVDSAANGSSNPLLTISNLDRVFFIGNATETEIAKIHVGDPVSVTMLAFPGRTFDARVTFISPQVDPATHRIAVKAEVDNADGALRPGMYGTFRVTTGAPTTAVAVPEQAVIFEGDTARVWIAGANRTLALRYFTAGTTVNGLVEALRGLRPGDRVVTRGSVFIDRAAQGDD